MVRDTGQGTYTLASGDKYVGEYKDGKRHGQGTFTCASGDKYVGEYKDDKRTVRALIPMPDGSKWVGAWENNKLNGYASPITQMVVSIRKVSSRMMCALYAQEKSKIDEHKDFCEEIGFTLLRLRGFADCVLELMKKD